MISMAKPQISEKEKQAVMEVLDSGMIAFGDKVHEFEAAFSGYVGTQFGVATTSGTTALEVALRALGIGTGDKVVTTAYSFIASTNSILYTGAAPVFADIDPKTFDIDPASAEKALLENPDAKAILVVHLFGQPCNMDAIGGLAEKYGVKIVEDCAQSHGAEWKGLKTGSIGTVSAFSFYPTKNMTTGEGGIVLANDEEIARRARLFTNHGMEKRYTHDLLGYNYRMTNISAAIGLEQLRRLDSFNDARRRNADYYNAHIRHAGIETPYAEPDGKHVYHQYTVKVVDGRREALIRRLEENGIGYGVFYPFSIPEQPAYQNMGFRTNWPATDEVKTQVLSLPVHPGLEEKDLEAVANAVNSF